MTAPITSREELLREAEEHLGFLSNLPGVHPHRIARIREALTVPAQGALEPFTAEDAWDELVHKDDRTSPEEYPEMALITSEELADFMRRGTTLPSTGLPAPAPHAEVREALEDIIKLADAPAPHLPAPERLQAILERCDEAVAALALPQSTERAVPVPTIDDVPSCGQENDHRRAVPQQDRRRK